MLSRANIAKIAVALVAVVYIVSLWIYASPAFFHIFHSPDPCPKGSIVESIGFNNCDTSHNGPFVPWGIITYALTVVFMVLLVIYLLIQLADDPNGDCGDSE